MKFRSALNLAGCSLAVLFYCCNHKAFDLSAYQKQYLVFGQGGGITGLRIEYTLLENGNIYQRDSRTDSLTFIKDAGNAFTTQAFQNFTALGLDTLKCYEPGDLYYFVERHQSGNAHRIVWGRPGFTQDPMIITYFNNLYRTAKKTSE